MTKFLNFLVKYDETIKHYERLNASPELIKLLDEGYQWKLAKRSLFVNKNDINKAREWIKKSKKKKILHDDLSQL